MDNEPLLSAGGTPWRAVSHDRRPGVPDDLTARLGLNGLGDRADVPAAAPAAPKRNRKIAIISVIVILSALTIVVAVTMGISLSRTATAPRTRGLRVRTALLT